MSTRGAWTGSRFLALAVLLACLPVTAAVIQAPAFACASGPYAVVLPRHYPSLHVIGKHTVVELGSQAVGSATLTGRRIAYVGMTAEVTVSSATPTAYRLESLDVISRRWNIGPLSVGQNPWRTVNDTALNDAAKDGQHRLVGPRDQALLTVRAGRIDAVSYRCGVEDAPAAAGTPAVGAVRN